MEIFKPKCALNLKGKLDDANYFFLYLFRGAKNMGVILCELSDPEKTVHNAAGLVSVHQAELRHTNREFPVGVLSGVINQAAAGALHRLYSVVDIVKPGEIHILFVIVPMAAFVPKLLI